MKKFLLSFLLSIYATLAICQLNMQLLDQMDYTVNNNDVWGWVDPDDGTEYAIVGLVNGVSIVELSDPQNIQEVQFVPGPNSTWRDIKTWGNYIYVTNESSGGLKVINMTNAPNNITWSNWTPFISGLGTLKDCHNLYIDEFGYCYLAGCNLNGGGALIVDVFSNPGSPQYISKGPSKYAHDVFVQNNKMYTSEINGGDLGIYNVSNKLNISQLASQETPYNFTHNAWVNEADNVVFTTDEKANAPVAAYDISDLNDIVALDQFRPLSTAGQGVIPHNVHVWDDWLIISYYTSGGIIADASRPGNIIEVGNWDTFLGGNGGFSGVWGAYPFLPSGLVLLTDISSGLYVCGVDYVRACWLEGQITNAVNGAAIFGAEIHIESNLTNEATSGLLGDYQTGQATPGTFNVVFSAPGFVTQTIPVVLQNGVLTILDVALQPLIPVTSYSGTVVSAIDGTPISGALVALQSSGFYFTAVTNGSGIFTFNNIYADDYTLTAAKWGHLHASIDVLPISFNTDPVVLEMYLGYQDDFILSQGWTTQTTAATGWWDRVEPVGTFLNGQFSNPDFDVPNDIGDRCFVTGNGGGAAGTDDVDDGMVRLISPEMDLTIYYEPVLSYFTWFVNGGGNVPPNDAFEVRISNGMEEVVLENISTSNPNWNNKSSFTISDYIAITSTMKVIFETSDLAATGHIVEAAVDAFRVSESAYPPFVSTDTLGCPGDQVGFSDPSSFGFSWSWVFENGNPANSDLQNQSVEYNMSGEYDVTLEVMTKTGQVFTIDGPGFISIGTPPTAEFTLNVDTLQASFTNSSTGGSSYYWDFGDGEMSTEQSPEHPYPAPGNYEVTLTVEGTCGPTVLTEEIVIPAYQPTANFTINQTIGCTPFVVEFSDMSFGFPDSWEWSFPGGDPSTSSEQNPTVTYQGAGSFDVSLKVINQAGENELAFDNIIEVNSAPATSFGFSNDGAIVSFDNTSTNADSFEWTFNDGSGTTSSDENPSHTFPGVGTFEVTLAATNACGTSYLTEEVDILAIYPTASFTANQTIGCTPFIVEFSDQSLGVPESWQWSFPGGNPAFSSEQNPTITYYNSGTYNVELLVENAAGDSEISQNDLIVVDASPSPGFTFDVTGPDVIFSNNSSNANSYEWDFGDMMGNGSTDAEPTYTFPGLGSFEVTLFATNDCGTTSFTETVVISVIQPTAEFAVNSWLGCAPLEVQFSDQSMGGEIDSWEWSFPGGDPAVSTEQNPAVVYNSFGTYNVSLKVSNAIGDSETMLTDLIMVGDSPTPSFTFDITGPEVVFTNTSSNGNSFEWNFGDGSGSTSTELDTEYTFPGLGAYEVTLNATNDCGTVSIIETIVISVIQPTADFSVNEMGGCIPFEVQFTDLSNGGEIDSWEWSFPGGDPTFSNEQNPTVVYENVGTFGAQLKVTNAIGDSQVNIADLIIVDDVPVAEFTFDVNGPEVTFENNSSNSVSFEWSFGDGLGNTSDEQDPFYIFENIGDYEVILTATNDCGSVVYSQIVSITSPTSTIGLDKQVLEFSAFPNPFNKEITVNFEMTHPSENAFIIVHNLLGEKIASIRLDQIKGSYILQYEIQQDGIYFLQLMVENRINEVIKVVKN